MAYVPLPSELAEAHGVTAETVANASDLRGAINRARAFFAVERSASAAHVVAIRADGVLGLFRLGKRGGVSLVHRFGAYRRSIAPATALSGAGAAA